MRGFFGKYKPEDLGLDVIKLFQSIATNIELDKLLGDTVPALVKYTASMGGAFYLANNATGKLEIKFSIGFSKNVYSEFDLNIGEGLVGTAALADEIYITPDIPADSVFITKTFLGMVKPKNVMLVPVTGQDRLLGVLALASLYGYKKKHVEFMRLSKHYFGAAISNSVAYERSKRLTAELQFQNKLIQDLNQDLENRSQEQNRVLNRVLSCVTGAAVYAVDKNHKVIFWNGACEKLFGFAADEAINSDLPTLLSRGNAAKAAVYQFKLDYAAEHGRYTESGVRRMCGGTPFYAEIAITAMRDEKTGELTGLTCITANVSENLKP